MDYPVIDFAGIGNESILQKELNYTTQPVASPDYNFLTDILRLLVICVTCLALRSSFVRYRGKSNPVLRKVGY